MKVKILRNMESLKIIYIYFLLFRYFLLEFKEIIIFFFMMTIPKKKREEKEN